MAAIDIGAEAIDRAYSFGAGYTYISISNPANADGKITSIEIWAEFNLVDCEVATFSEGAANVFTTHDSVTIGTVTAGSKQTFEVNLDVQEGDYIGIYFTGGDLDWGSVTGAGTWYLSGDNIPCRDTTFALMTDREMSLYGTGATVEVGASNALLMGANF